MSSLNKEDWNLWNEERQRFFNRESEGYDIDIQALVNHIHRLTEVAPKDKAGWLNSNALDVINHLKQDLTRAKVFFGQAP